MSNLTTMSKNICGILSLGEIDDFDFYRFQELFEDLDKFFNGNSKQYGWIMHNLDVLPSGEYKTRHIHFVATMKQRKRLGTFLNELSDCTGLNPLAITISKYTSFEASYQYLVHRNDPDKVQYVTYLVHTNLPKEEVKVLLSEEATALDLDRLSDVVSSSSSKTEVLQKIGLYYYRLYRGVINDIWNDLHPYDFKKYKFDKNGEVKDA